MPIDYSKWDHLDEYSDDDSHHDEPTNTPRVTKLDAPGRVTFGGSEGHGGTPGQVKIEVDPTTSSIEPSLPSTDIESKAIAASVIPPRPSAPSSANQVEAWTEKGGAVAAAGDRRLYWSQDRYTVSIRLELFGGEKVKRVNVDGIVSFLDRHCATGTHRCRLVVAGCKETSPQDEVAFLEGDLPHPIHWSQYDDTDGKVLDWSIERSLSDDDGRFVAITLNKAVPMQGLFIWWTRPLTHFEEISLDEGEVPRSGAAKEFLDAWDEAHRKFREKKRTPQQLE